VIFCGGYNVYPRIIEDAAYQHPAIKEAIAIGIRILTEVSRPSSSWHYTRMQPSLRAN
jgi:acyl-CoA synthetase (AMP-forming)/AMP-acid ligase II